MPTPPIPSFLDHLRDTFGWTAEEATRALGEWMLGTEVGRALRVRATREVSFERPGNHTSASP